jgi:hemolysin activation/secretion protein
MTRIKASYFVALLGCGALLGAAGAQAQPAPAANPDLAVQVTQFRFTGNTVLSNEELASVLKMFPGHSLSMEQLNRAAEEVQALYRSRGWFLARAYLPAQNPRDGVVEIAILEGRIDKVSVSVAPGAPISQASAESFAHAHLKRGQLITDRGIEKPLLLLRDVPRVAAKSVLEPGSETGTANVAIEVSGDPATPLVGGRVELDNYGTATTGRVRLTGEVDLNNPFGLGDALSVRAFVANEHGNTFGRASYTIPVGPYGTRFGASVARLNYLLGNEFAALGPTGVANVASLNASHPFIRSKNANLLGQLVIERKRLTDEIEAFNSKETSSLRAATLSLNGDFRDSEASANQVSLSVSNGKLTFDDPLRQANDESPAVGLHQAGTYTKTVLTARRVHVLGDGMQALMTLQAQAASKNLPGAEKFALGGTANVRAFPIGEVVGDQGYALTLELQSAFASLSNAGCTTAATAFYDFGRATINHTTPAVYSGYNSRSIGGPGIGVNIDCARGFMLRFSVAAATQGELPGASGSMRAWLMAGYGF